ncbi:uncharacterized protein N7498_003074 [Penicillium cinerascens]|uniref:Uncharacterized protein n=1 Tax=Penicillium cinerascens TaxID=70096 RepID=A0A9W9T6J4_9EURO|nr:uncharacterized protein N7498_003074 [Penicillium cinerascens]KAJ5211428.1 hypothetical protein N7498_003074 [Penicillium cinerascens]
MVELLDNAGIDVVESVIYFHVDDPLKDVTQVPSRLHKTLLLNLRASEVDDGNLCIKAYEICTQFLTPRLPERLRPQKTGRHSDSLTRVHFRCQSQKIRIASEGMQTFCSGPEPVA